jgi:hypothetical protein
MTPVYVDDAATLSSRCAKGDSAAPAGGMPPATGPKIGGDADRAACIRNSRIAQRFTRLSPGSRRRPVQDTARRGWGEDVLNCPRKRWRCPHRPPTNERREHDVAS